MHPEATLEVLVALTFHILSIRRTEKARTQYPFYAGFRYKLVRFSAEILLGRRVRVAVIVVLFYTLVFSV